MQCAAQELTRILLPSARLVGPYAHALTVDSHLSASRVQTLAPNHYLETFNRLQATHLVCDAAPTPEEEYKRTQWFKNEGVAVELIERFYIRGKAVLLYRLATAEGDPASLYEQAVRAAVSGNPEVALEHLRGVLQIDPDSAAAWAGMGFIHQKQGEMEPASQCYEFSVTIDPYRVSAQLALAELCLEQGMHRRALDHLKHILVADPTNKEVRAEIRKLSAFVDQEARVATE